MTKGRQDAEGGLDQLSKVWCQASRIDLAERLIEQSSDTAELADHGVIGAWHGSDIDASIKGELPSEMVGREARMLCPEKE